MSSERIAVKNRQKELFAERDECCNFSRDRCLPEICLDIRMALNGSAEPWHDHQYEQALKLLRDVIRTWEYPDRKDTVSDHFDSLVFQMVETTIVMLEEAGIQA